MTLTLELSPEQQDRLQAAAASRGVSPTQYAVQLLDERLREAERQAERKRQETITMLQSWREEGDPEKEREAYEEFTKSLDENRSSYRKLFPPELKGISW